MPKTLPKDPNRTRVGWQIPGPDNREPDPTRQHQAGILDGETVARVVDRHQSVLLLELPSTLARGLLRPVLTLDLLLGVLRARAQPANASPRRRQILIQQKPSRIICGFRPLARGNTFIPDPPAATPLRDHCPLREDSRAQPVHESDDPLFNHKPQTIR